MGEYRLDLTCCDRRLVRLILTPTTGLQITFVEGRSRFVEGAEPGQEKLSLTCAPPCRTDAVLSEATLLRFVETLAAQPENSGGRLRSVDYRLVERFGAAT